MTELKQLKTSDIKQIRDEILEQQNGKCAICSCTITEETGISLDHQHKKKCNPIGVDGDGLVRGVLCRSCNVLEGRIWNNTLRYKQPKSVQERIDFLESLIEYYKKDNYPLIHPSEKEVEKTVSKSNYNRLKRTYSGKKKLPEYPKSGKLTLGLQLLFEQYQIQPYN